VPFAAAWLQIQCARSLKDCAVWKFLILNGVELVVSCLNLPLLTFQSKELILGLEERMPT